MEPSRADGDQSNLDHESRIARLEKIAVEHTQEFRLVIQHIDKSMEIQRQEFSAMLEKQLAEACKSLRIELEAKIEAAHRDLEAKMAGLQKQLWGAVVIVVSMFGIAVTIFGILAR
ncbi:MAG TPA: hypothetical protein VGF27_05550 [Pseudoduganella sp.]